MLTRNFTRTRVWSLSGQEEQTFKGFDLNLQSHTHNTIDCLKHHSSCSTVCAHSWLPEARQGWQQSSRKAEKGYGLSQWQKDLPCYGILWNPPSFPFALWENRDLNCSREHMPGISGWSCWKRRKKNPFWPPCHHITSLSQEPSRQMSNRDWEHPVGILSWLLSLIQSRVLWFHFINIPVVPSSSSPPHPSTFPGKGCSPSNSTKVTNEHHSKEQEVPHCPQGS